MSGYFTFRSADSTANFRSTPLPTASTRVKSSIRPRSRVHHYLSLLPTTPLLRLMRSRGKSGAFSR